MHDPDWFPQWHQRAQNVTSEVLQRLWAKVLAGEFTKPNSYSVSTLDTLSQLSKADADLIGLLGPFVMDLGLIFKAPTLLKDAGLPLNALLDLEELGIITGLDGVGLSQQYNVEGTAAVGRLLIRCNGKAVYRVFKDNLQMMIPVYRLTRVGRELLSLGRFEPNTEYLYQIGKHIKEKGYTSVQIGDWIATAPNAGRLLNPTDID